MADSPNTTTLSETRRGMFKIIAGGLAASTVVPAVSIAKDLTGDGEQEDPETLALFDEFDRRVKEYEIKQAVYIKRVTWAEACGPDRPSSCDLLIRGASRKI